MHHHGLFVVTVVVSGQEQTLRLSRLHPIRARHPGADATVPALVLRYGAAVVLAAVSVTVSANVGDLKNTAPYLVPMAAVMIVSWFGGFGPGLLAGILSALAVDYYTQAPLHRLNLLDRKQVIVAVVFIIVTWMVSWLNGARLRAEAQQAVLLRHEQEARREAIAGRNRMSFMAEVSAALATSLDYQTTLRQVARLVVPTLADWCVVHVVGDDGAVEQLEVAHVDPEKLAWVRQLQERFPPNPGATRGVYQVIRTGQPELHSNVSSAALAEVARGPEHLEALRAAGMASALIVPMTSRGRVLGTLTFVSSSGGRRFTEDDLEVAEIVARRCAQAIENARLFRDMHIAEERYRGLFEGTAEAVLVISPGGRILDANVAASTLLGYSRAELRRLPASEIAATDPGWLESATAAFASAGGWRAELSLRRKNATAIPAEGQGRRVDLPTGPVFVVTWRDISERHELERLQHAFLASVSHDLKNPLAAAKATTQLTRRRLRRGEIPAREELDRSLTAIEEALTRTGSQLDELSDVARARLGQALELNLGPVDLVALARRSAEEQQRATDRHRIEVNAARPRIIGRWDGARLQRVLDNLLANAVKYSPAGGAIELRAGIEHGPAGDAWACLTVRDHGVGIPAADLPQLFTRFYRGTNVLGRFRGTGMGLAGARQILEQHGGTITVDSTEGAGSTFTVRLPLDVADAPPGLLDAAGAAGTVNAAPG